MTPTTERIAFHDLNELREMLNRMTPHELAVTWPADRGDGYVLSIVDEVLSDGSIATNYSITPR